MTSFPSTSGAAEEPAILVEHLSRSFGPVQALRDVSLAAARGSVVGLLGHNGAGKTTLVNILTTLLPPTSGSARVAGFDVATDGNEVRRRIGLTGQFASVDEHLSGLDNLILIARLLGASPAQAAARADELLGTFDLTGAARRPSRTYSGGMRRRLDLAASMVGHPDVIFLDEPTTGLDPQARAGVWAVVEELVGQGTTILLTTQYLDEADRLADSITVLSEGAVVASGTAAQLKAEVGTLTVTAVVASGEDAERGATAVRSAGLEASVVPDRTAIAVPVPASRDLARVVRALDGAGIEAADLQLTEPSLDDVYLALTRPTPQQPAA